MTRYVKNLIKASLLSLSLTIATVYFAVSSFFSVDPYWSALGQLATFVFGIFGLVSIVSTIVYLFVGDE